MLIKGEATAEEVAAIVAVLQTVASAGAEAPTRPRSEWAAHHRKVRTTYPHGPGGWRSSGLPR